MTDKSCIGCKFIYLQDSGWSNWTVENTDVICAKNRNPNLPAEGPWDWEKEGKDNWPKTQNSRCELYDVGQTIHLDVDGEAKPEDFTDDEEVITAIKEQLK